MAVISGEQSSSCPLTPSDLLIALHNIDCTGDESMMKCVIKGVTICSLRTTDIDDFCAAKNINNTDSCECKLQNFPIP